MGFRRTVQNDLQSPLRERDACAEDDVSWPGRKTVFILFLSNHSPLLPDISHVAPLTRRDLFILKQESTINQLELRSRGKENCGQNTNYFTSKLN